MRGIADFRPYQHQALAFIERTPRAYLAAKAGAGKTAVALAYISGLFDARRVLVVAPKRVVPQWAREAANWQFSAGLTFAEYVGPREERARALATQSDVLVCSFEHFAELMRAVPLSQWRFDLVVFDEASRLRNGGRRGSVAWKAMNAISGKTRARLLLMSGSPRPGTAHELYGPAYLLDRGDRLGRTLKAFRTAFLEPWKVDRYTGQVYSWRLRTGMEPALYGALQDLYFAVAPDLGLPHVVIDRRVDLPASVSQACDSLARTQVLDLDDLSLVAPSQGTVAGKLHQMCQGAVFDNQGRPSRVHDEKLDELREIVEEVAAPVVVCVWYQHDRERVLAALPGAVDITTDEGLRRALAGEVEVAVLHPASAGHGIDGLQAHFSALIWFALPASFELYDQTNKRLVRSGQRETVRVYRIIAANGIVDEKIVARLAEKEAEQDQFFQHLERAHDE